MKRTLAFILAAALLATLPTSKAQTPAPAKSIAFAVSTIKPAKGTDARSFLYNPSGLRIENITLEEVIRNAYQLQDDQLLNTPAWVRTVRYDIEAKVDDEDRETLKKLEA